jgi:hypothetical protein
MVFGNGVFASFRFYERFPLYPFAGYFQRTNNLGDAVDDAFVTAMAANQLSTVIYAYVTGFLVKAEALYLHCRFM